MSAVPLPAPASRLRAWLEARRWSARHAATEVGCSASMMHKLLSGERSPGLDVAFAIERASQDWEHGPILASEWASDLAATGSD